MGSWVFESDKFKTWDMMGARDSEQACVLGHNHPHVADSKYNLASLHKTRRVTEKALQLFLECKQI